MSDYKIIHTNDHYEVYLNEKFYCSADTKFEAEKEIENARF